MDRIMNNEGNNETVLKSTSYRGIFITHSPTKGFKSATIMSLI